MFSPLGCSLPLAWRSLPYCSERWLNAKRSGRIPTEVISDADSNSVVAQKAAEFHCGSVSSHPSRSFIYWVVKHQAPGSTEKILEVINQASTRPQWGSLSLYVSSKDVCWSGKRLDAYRRKTHKAVRGNWKKFSLDATRCWSDRNTFYSYLVSLKSQQISLRIK